MTDRQLVLIRHAKAANGEIDIERPLAPRGLSDAVEIGRWLAAHAVSPDRVFVSPSRRTVQTWAQASSVLSIGVDPHSDPRIYDNTVTALMSVLQQTPEPVQTVVLVGHNPSISELALAFDDGLGDVAARRELARGFPTSGVAIFAVRTGWAELGPQAAMLTHFGCPRA